MVRILVVEDEAELRELLQENLTFEGFDVQSCGDGRRALDLHGRQAADLWVLDLMLPGLDGFRILQTLRDRGDGVPVLMLTARGAEVDRVRGLSFGADDYMVKPFSLLELGARIRAILRRTQPQAQAGVLCSGSLRLDLRSLRLTLGAESLEVGTRELRLLEAFLRNPLRTLSRQDMLELAWGPDHRPALRTVDVYVARLRKHLGTEREWIRTMGGEGYRWMESAQRVP